MTNYEQLFQIQMQALQFVKSYYEAWVERLVDKMFDILKDIIIQIHPTVDQESHLG